MIETQKPSDNVITLPVARPEQAVTVPPSQEVASHREAIAAARHLIERSADPTGPEAQRILTNARQVHRDMVQNP